MSLLTTLLIGQTVAWKAVSVEDYGAVGDNYTDNTKAFRAALRAVKDEGGGEVLVSCACARETLKTSVGLRRHATFLPCGVVLFFYPLTCASRMPCG